MKDYDKNEELLYLKYCNVNNLNGWEMSLNFSVNNFEWIKDTSKFNEDFIKNCNEGSKDGYFKKIILKNYINFMKVYHFYLRQ